MFYDLYYTYNFDQLEILSTKYYKFDVFFLSDAFFYIIINSIWQCNTYINIQLRIGKPDSKINKKLNNIYVIKNF